MGYNDIDAKMARAKGLNLSISTKTSIEICKFLKGKTTAKAKAVLARVITKDQAIPYTRFNWDTGHRAGDMAAGRYPLKASTEILAVLNNVEKNALDKGLSTENLVITHMLANKASSPWHHGRQSRRKMKRTHVEIIVTETEIKAKGVKPVAKAAVPKAEAKVEETDSSATEKKTQAKPKVKAEKVE